MAGSSDSSVAVGGIAGVRLWPLQRHVDHRGSFAEVFRQEWHSGLEPLQLNVVTTAAGVMRGVHLHGFHEEYVVVAQGEMTVGLRDMRPGSPNVGQTALVELSDGRPEALLIPRGVAHGCYFRRPTVHLVGVNRYWDPADDLAVHWADPSLAIPWPMTMATVSDRDA